MEVASFQDRGRRGRRHGYQHDRIAVHQSAQGSIFAVFDGHGTYERGHVVAEYCATHLVPLLTASKAWNTRSADLDASDDALVHALIDVVAQLEKGADPGPDLRDYPGTTLCAVVVKDGWLYTVNVGDSRAVLARCAPPSKRVHTPLLGCLQLTTDHACGAGLETARIEDAGGWVQEGRLNGRLDMSRTIGDYDYKQYRMFQRFNPSQHPFKPTLLVSTPDVTCRKLADDDVFLIIASDGLWTPRVSNDMLVMHAEASLVLRRAPAEVAADLVQYAVDEGGSQDNVSVVFVKLRELPQKQIVSWLRKGRNVSASDEAPERPWRRQNSQSKHRRRIWGISRERAV